MKVVTGDFTMDQEAFDRYLKDRYQDQVDWYDGQAVKNKRIYYRIRFWVILLSVITPILVGLTFPSDAPVYLRIMPILTSIALAFLTLLGATYKYYENWTNYRNTCETLRKEIHFYNAGLGDYSDAIDKEAKFVERVELTISHGHTLWLSTSEGRGPSESAQHPQE